MKSGTLLRIGIYLVGLWALLSGTTSSVYYLREWLAGPAVDQVGRPYMSSFVFGHAITPLLFAMFCFGFAGAITRLLLGPSAEELITGISAAAAARILLKVLGLYLVGMYGPPLIATLYELLAVRSGNTSVSEVQVTSDLISNGIGLTCGIWLSAGTDRVLGMLFPHNPA